MTADVLAARAGDPHAFTRLVRAQANTVCAIAAAITGDVRASEEVAQDVFVAAWQGIGRLKNPASFGPWLRQLTRNRAHDHVRSRLRRREVGEAPLAGLTAPDLEERSVAAERERAVWVALEALPSDHREVLILFYREGRSVRQVATLLELSEPAVRKRLSRARAELRADVYERLGEVLDGTAPGAAFVAGVAAAIAAPATAQAATAAAGKGIGAVLGGAGIGAAFGLAGIALGYRAAARTVGEDERRALRRGAIAQVLAVLAATGCFLALPSPASVVVGMTLLLAVLWASVLAVPVGRTGRGGVGLIGGSAAGLAGAVAGAVAAGSALDLVVGQLVIALSFLAAPVVLFAVVPAVLAVPRRWLVAGALTWLAVLPALLGGPALAMFLTRSPLAAIVALSLCAGVFEETARYLLFRRIGGDVQRAIVVGVGHGGVESLVLGVQMVAGALLVGGTPGWALATLGLARLAILLVHVGFSVLAWRAASERRPWLWALGVGLHVALDLVAFGAPTVGPVGLWIGGAAVALAALAAAWQVRSAL